MWHYFKTFYFIIFWYFLMFSSVALCGAMWHYVALSEFFIETKKSHVSQYLLDLCKFCGTMWHYVALCGTILTHVIL